jgi:hypothetical protein
MANGEHESGLTYLLSVRGHAVFQREDGDTVHGQLVGGTEYSDRDFLEARVVSMQRDDKVGVG